MTPEQIERVFGRGRLQMVTGKHVEVFREAVGAGRRRKYTKRFLNTLDADFGQWTEREWRILARLFGHGIDCVPEVVQFDRGDGGGTQLVQTYDAGATVDQWATILPVTRGGRVFGHVFEDCAHWWALAQHCLRVLQAIHELSVVHLDIKGDNVCIPVGPSDFDPNGRDLHLFPRFDKLALIDFAFALVSRESLTTALPIGWQTDYDYQSPRLLHALEAGRRGDLQPTRDLDWRCDMYSLAAMLKRYLPVEDAVLDAGRNHGWSTSRAMKAKELILALREAHDREATLPRPHQALIDLAAACLAEPDMAASLAAGWTLALDAHVTPVAPTALTPLTRLAPTLRVLVTPRVVVPPTIATVVAIPSTIRRRVPAVPAPSIASPSIASPASPRQRRRALAAIILAVAPLGAALALVGPDVVARWPHVTDGMRAALQRLPFSAPAPRDALSRTEASLGRADATAPTVASTPTIDGTASPDVAPSGTSASPGEATATATESPPPGSPVARSEAKQDALPTERVLAEASDSELRTNLARDADADPANASPAATAEAALRPTPASPSMAGAPPRTARETRPASVPPPPKFLARSRPPVAAPPPAKNSLQVATVPTPPRIRFFNDLPAKRSTPAIAAAPAGPAAPPAPVVAEAVVPEAAPLPPLQQEPAVAAPRPAPPPPSQLAAKPAAASPPAPAQPRGLFDLLLSFAQRSDQRKAPIEDRSSAPSVARAAPPASVPPRVAPRAPDDSAALVRSPAEVANAAATMAVPGVAPLVGHMSPETASPPAATYPASRPPVPRPLPPVTATERIPESVAAAPDLAEQAQRSLAQSVPYSAARAQPEVARVLWVAANAHTAMQERSIVEAVQRAWPLQQVATTAGPVAPGVAKQLAEEARQAYVNERNVRRAVDLQLRAFGANPRDPEVAGNLAYLYLKVSPAQPEISRQLVLHAMALGSLSRRAARVDDWNTLAVASALTRREADAINAFYVVLALTRDLDRSCKEALAAVDNHGGNLVVPVQTMMARIRQQGRTTESAYCAWPVHWRSARR